MCKCIIIFYTLKRLLQFSTRVISPPNATTNRKRILFMIFLRFQNPHKLRRLAWSRIFAVRISLVQYYSSQYIYTFVHVFFISGITRYIRRFLNLWTNRRPRWLVVDVSSVCWSNCTGEFLNQVYLKITNQHINATFHLTYVFYVCIGHQ